MHTGLLIRCRGMYLSQSCFCSCWFTDAPQPSLSLQLQQLMPVPRQRFSSAAVMLVKLYSCTAVSSPLCNEYEKTTESAVSFCPVSTLKMYASLAMKDNIYTCKGSFVKGNVMDRENSFLACDCG